MIREPDINSRAHITTGGHPYSPARTGVLHRSRFHRRRGALNESAWAGARVRMDSFRRLPTSNTISCAKPTLQARQSAPQKLLHAGMPLRNTHLEVLQQVHLGGRAAKAARAIASEALTAGVHERLHARVCVLRTNHAGLKDNRQVAHSQRAPPRHPRMQQQTHPSYVLKGVARRGGGGIRVGGPHYGEGSRRLALHAAARPQPPEERLQRCRALYGPQPQPAHTRS